MSKCHRIIDKAKLVVVVFVVAVIALLLVGYGQGVGHNEHGESSGQSQQHEQSEIEEISAHDDVQIEHREIISHSEHGQTSGQSQNEPREMTEDEMLEKSLFIKGNFEVQHNVLATFYDCATRFREIFGTIDEEEQHKKSKSVKALALDFGRISMNDKKLSLANALQNLLLDIHAVLEMIGDMSSLDPFFDKANMVALLTECLELAQQQQEHEPFELFAPGRVQDILNELNSILKQMASSEWRQKWRKEAKELFESENTSEFEKLKTLRIAYDSVYIRLFIVRATFYIAMIANKNTSGTAAVMIKQQIMAKELEKAVKRMKDYLENEQNLRARVELALNNGEKLTISLLNTAYNNHNNYLSSIGLFGRKLTDRLAEGDEKAFAILMGNGQKYAPAEEDGPAVVMKYQMMQDVAALWQLRDAVIICTKNELLWRAELIERNLVIQTKILTVKRDSQLVKIFNPVDEPDDERKMSQSYRDRVLKSILRNLGLDIPAVVKLIRRISRQLFDRPNFVSKWLIKMSMRTPPEVLNQLDTELNKWLAFAMRNEKKPSKSFVSKRVKPILELLNIVLKQMTTSDLRQEWREEVKQLYRQNLFDTLNLLNHKRIDYDSLYIRLDVVRVMLETAMIAGENKPKADNKPGAADMVKEQQKMAEQQEETVMNMSQFIESEENVLARIREALNKGVALTRDQLNDVQRDQNCKSLNFPGKIRTIALVQGDEQAFAQLMGKEPEYVPDEPMVVLKYEMMQDVAALWQLERDFLRMPMENPSN